MDRVRLEDIEYEALSDEAREARVRASGMFHFSHTMEAHIGGLTANGFVVTGFFEDRRPEADGNPIRRYMPSYYVLRAQRMA